MKLALAGEFPNVLNLQRSLHDELHAANGLTRGDIASKLFIAESQLPDGIDMPQRVRTSGTNINKDPRTEVPNFGGRLLLGILPPFDNQALPGFLAPFDELLVVANKQDGPLVQEWRNHATTTGVTLQYQFILDETIPSDATDQYAISASAPTIFGLRLPSISGSGRPFNEVVKLLAEDLRHHSP